jgi:hypothetical protein
VLREFRIINDRLEEARPLLRPGRFCEVRYEKLTANPLGELERVYAELELKGFDEARPCVEQYLEQTTDYETNKYAITDEQRTKIDRRWGDVIQRYGYC